MGIYTNQALQAVLEAGLAREYDKVPGYFLTNMFYGHAQVRSSSAYRLVIS